MTNLSQLVSQETPPLFWLSGFHGCNLHDDRRAIDDQECAWMENFAPLGDRNARAMYDVGHVIYDAPVPDSIVFHFPFNIGATYYHAVFFADGSAVQVADVGGAVVVMGVAGTFAVAPTLPACAQWGASGIVIVTATKYFAWDGTLYSPGNFAPAWLTGFTTLVTVGTTNNTTSVTAVGTTQGLVTGMTVTSGTGDIPAGTLVQTFTSGPNTITLTQAATGANVGEVINVGWAMPSGVKGSAIEVYQRRVWIADGAKFLNSGPANGADFSTADGGGTTPSTDGFLQVSYVNLKQSNSYLYLFGDGSINVVSNVQTSGSPATTTFNNLNVDPQNGLGWRDALVPFGNSLCFANPTGVFQLYGGSAVKISDKIDKLFEKADWNAVTPTMFAVSIFAVRCIGIMLNTLDPTTNTQRTIMALWNQKQWFIASQSLALKFTTIMKEGGDLEGCANDGTTIVEMFKLASDTLPKRVQTKLWQGRSNLIFKTAMDVYADTLSKVTTAGVKITGTIDSSTQTPVAFAFSNVINFINNLNQPLQFVNNANLPLTFISDPDGVQGQDAAGAGLRLGMTIESTSPDFVMLGLGMTYCEESFYGH